MNKKSTTDETIAELKRRITILEEFLKQSETKRSALITPLGTPIRGSIVADLYLR